MYAVEATYATDKMAPHTILILSPEILEASSKTSVSMTLRTSGLRARSSASGVSAHPSSDMSSFKQSIYRGNASNLYPPLLPTP